jgi:hypothetical protein
MTKDELNRSRVERWKKRTEGDFAEIKLMTRLFERINKNPRASALQSMRIEQYM